MAGHSKWANIKHRKARQDSKRSKMWSKCSRAIIVAAKNGGPDPDTNLTLRYAIDEAKAENMPKDTIEKAIAKGAGAGEGDNYEPAVYEGYGPGGVAILVEALTDNRNRTASEVRSIFTKGGGNLGTSGSVAYIFSPRGVITIEKSAVDEERLMEVALEAGAEDIADEGEIWEVATEPTQFTAVRDAIAAAGIEPVASELTMIAENTVEVSTDDARKVMNLVENLEDCDDVQKVHANFDIPDELMAEVEG